DAQGGGVAVSFSGSAAGGTESALDVCGRSPVVPDAERRPAGNPRPAKRMGDWIPGGHGSTETACDPSPSPVPQPNHSDDQRNVGGNDKAGGKRATSGLKPAPGHLVEVSPEKARAEFLEYRLASAEEARTRQAQQRGAFFAERNAWLDATA